MDTTSILTKLQGMAHIRTAVPISSCSPPPLPSQQQLGAHCQQHTTTTLFTSVLFEPSPPARTLQLPRHFPLLTSHSCCLRCVKHWMRRHQCGGGRNPQRYNPQFCQYKESAKQETGLPQLQGLAVQVRNVELSGCPPDGFLF